MMRNERGLTLVEVLAALVLIGLAVTLFVSLSSTVSINTRVEDRRSEALEIAENELNVWKERVKAGETLPAQPVSRSVGAFTVRVLQLLELTASTDMTALYTGQLTDVPATRVSMQSVVYRNQQPLLLTVVVSWEAES